MFTNLMSAAQIPSWVMPLVLGLVLVAMLGISFWQNKKRTQQHTEMMNSLAVGTKIMTIGRMVGRIAQVNSDNTLIINVGTDENPTLILIDRAAIGMVLENVSAPVVEAPEVPEIPTVEETVEETRVDEEAEDNCDCCDIPDAEIPEFPDPEFPDVKFPDEE